ncbi:MAG TPA: hypothetical protein VG867_02980 [Rhizomicrobium sp.]|nr:hypothetical protein [Rhizomicrobium sp.]
MSEPRNTIAKDTEASAMPHGSAAAASVNMTALIPFIILAALFMVTLFVMHEDAGAAATAAARADAAVADAQEAKREARLAEYYSVDLAEKLAQRGISLPPAPWLNRKKERPK